MADCILFDEDDKPIGVSHPRGDLPSASTLKKRKAQYAKQRKDCTRQECEDAERYQRDFRIADGARRRTGQHGYTGGDGFITLP